MGTNRIVIILSDKVIKIPKRFCGIKANKEEFENYLCHPFEIAKTERCLLFLKQERLYNIEIYPLDAKRDDLPLYAQPLYDLKLNNRLQIGQNKNGQWKIFDYEDIKFYMTQNVYF